jgi:ribosomal protein S18 acetylase RimI-like enzyme
MKRSLKYGEAITLNEFANMLGIHALPVSPSVGDANMSGSIQVASTRLCWGSDADIFMNDPVNNARVPLKIIWDSRKQDDCYWFALMPPVEKGMAGLSGRVAGVCFLRGFADKWEEIVFGMVVGEEYDKLGIGTLLLQTAYVEARYRNLISLRLHVSPDNKNAVDLYTKFGFIAQEIRHNGEVVMRKPCV